MINWLLNKIYRLKREQVKRAIARGIEIGWELRGEAEKRKGVIISPNVDREIEEILRREGV